MLSVRGMSSLDISGAQTFIAVLEQLREAGVDVAFCGVPEASKEMMDRAGITEIMGEDGFYWSTDRALEDLRPCAIKVCESIGKKNGPFE